jgi:hypothetical protein
VLHVFSVDWKRRTCTAQLDVFADRSKDAVPHVVTWHGVEEVFIPHRNPWGPSTSINSARTEASRVYIIEMQSGDEIRITAERFDFAARQV